MPFDIESTAHCFPFQIDMAFFIGQRTVFRGVGAVLMKRHRNCNCYLGRETDFRTRGGDAVGIAVKRRGCRTNQLCKGNTFPVFAGQQIVRPRQCAKLRNEIIARNAAAVWEALVRDRLNQRKRIFTLWFSAWIDSLRRSSNARRSVTSREIDSSPMGRPS